MEEEKLDDKLSEIRINDRTEMEGVANIMFNPEKLNSSINITEFERSGIITCDVVEGVFQIQGFNLTKDFKELSQSISGWKTERFVNLNQSRNERQDGGVFKKLLTRQNDVL